jgi:hypothetical protein
MGLDRLVLAAFCLSAIHCGGDNKPSVVNGNVTGGTGATSASPTAGTSAMSQATSGSPAGAAGKPSTSSAGTTGSMMRANAGSSAGKSGSSGSAGSMASDDAGTPSGSGGTGSTMTGMFSPLCDAVPPTAAGQAPTKGGACTASDPQLCYKTCGPQSIGFKSETCTNGAYAEQSGCSFADMDYACFKIPATVDASCPTTAPQATMPCEVAACTSCSVGGNYLDSSGASKTGYCVCPMAGASGMRKWSCASTTAWPCPAGRGC